MRDDRPLEGLTVIALEQAVAAPLCTSRLADAGARVIKIERSVGETARHYDSTVHGTSAYFAWLNRGKQSAALDLKDAVDLALMRRMLSRADIFVQNLAPGAAARLGLDFETLQESNPRLIKASISGFSAQTTHAEHRAYDLLIQAESGVCSVTGPRDAPSKVGVSIADIATGMTAHAAILEALIQRGITGHGKAVEVSMFDCMADWMNVPLLHHDYAAQPTERHGMSHASVYPYRPYACLDGEVIAVVQNPREWKSLCADVLDRPDLECDPRFETNAQRVKHRDALDAEMEPVFAALTRAEAIKRLARAHLAYGQVSDVADLSEHPALRRVRAVTQKQDFLLAAPPIHPLSARQIVPELGEHTEAIRKEFG